MSKCLICNHQLQEFLDLGTQPCANAFVSKEKCTNEQYTYHLRLGLCPNCSNVQTMDRPEKEQMFNKEYAYYSSTNEPMVKHFKETSDLFKNRFLKKDSLIVEIGSNDGVFLKNFEDYKHLGIEPSENVAQRAMERGLKVWSKFFNDDTAQEISTSLGKADLIFAANVFGHVEEINSIVSGIKNNLKESGVFAFEIYYLPSMVKNKSFDLIYDEHIFFYTLKSLNYLFNSHGLELFDCEIISVHGDSIRGYVGHKGCHPKTKQLQDLVQKERELKLDTITPLRYFADSIAKKRDDILNLVESLKLSGKMIAGYGATAKSTTLLNYCNLNNESISFIVDNTPFKQGKLSPLTNIPIIPEEEFNTKQPDYTILFAWNYAKEIMTKQQDYNGKWILIHPQVEVIND